MSDVAMETPDASEVTQILKPNLRMRQPDLFTGDRDHLETWILQFDRHFHIEGDNVVDEDKVTLATTYMRGDAEKWVTPILKRYMDGSVTDVANKRLVEDWDLFKIRLREIFSPSAEVTKAEQKIQNLRQTKSAADYTTQFQRYAELVQWDDTALKRMYKQGLKPTVRAELMRTGVAITDVQSLYKEAIRLDNQIYELALEEKSYGRPLRDNSKHPSQDLGKKHQKKNYGKKGRFQSNQGRQRNAYPPKNTIPGYYASDGLEDMHINTLVKGKPDSPPSKKKIACYGCGKEGHMIRDCRSKNKVTRRINMLDTEHEAEDPTEWTVVDPIFTVETGEGEWVSEDTVTLQEKEQVLTDAVPTKDECDELQEYIDQGIHKGLIRKTTTIYTQYANEDGGTTTWKTVKTLLAETQQALINEHAAEPEEFLTMAEATKQSLQKTRHALNQLRLAIEKKRPHYTEREGVQRYEDQLQKLEEQHSHYEKIVGINQPTKPKPGPTYKELRELEEQLTGLTTSTQQQQRTIQSIRKFQGLFDEEVRRGRIVPDEHAPGGYRLKTAVDVSYLNGQTMRHGPYEKESSAFEQHPGTRVPGAWDQDSDKENHDPTERALTPEELAIHTPPASPKLVRQDATVGMEEAIHPHSDGLAERRRSKKTRGYTNDGQALVINDEPDWVQKAVHEYEQQKGHRHNPNTPLSREPQYDLDYRNPLHGLLSWTACFYNECNIHFSDKSATGHWPCRRSQCKWQAFDCPKDTCEKHLWDKRTTVGFLNMTQAEQDAQNLLANGSCLFKKWQLCMQEECKAHKEQKQRNGFLAREMEEEPFLGLGPAASPDAATPLTQNDSSSYE